VRIPRLAGGLRTITVALGAADGTPAPTVGDVAELFHIDMDHRPGVLVLVTADRFPGTDIDIAEPVQPASNEHDVHRGCQYASQPAIWTGWKRFFDRR
jgi:hypothetical protein